jgi:hypothetical protein
MTTLAKLLTSMCLALAFPALLACEEQGPLERAGERADEAAEDAGDALEDAADEVEDAADDLDDNVNP